MLFRGGGGYLMLFIKFSFRCFLAFLFIQTVSFAQGINDKLLDYGMYEIMYLKENFRNYAEGTQVILKSVPFKGQCQSNIGLVNVSVLETEKNRVLRIRKLTSELKKYGLTRHMYLTKDYLEHKRGTEVTLNNIPNNNFVPTNVGSLGLSYLAIDQYKLFIENPQNCEIKFLPPNEHLKYTNNMLLPKGHYKLSISKKLYISVAADLNMVSDLRSEIKLDSIFTDYGGVRINKLIESGEISLDEEFDGKSILYLLIENFSKNYLNWMGKTYGWMNTDAPIDKLTNTLQYFIK